MELKKDEWKELRRNFKDKVQQWMVYKPKHPNRDVLGFIPFHELVVEEKLCRYLKKDEFVAHIDNDKLNNNPSNLFVCSTRRAGDQLEKQLLNIAYDMVKNNIIGFNPEEGRYFEWSEIQDEMLDAVNELKSILGE